MVQIRTRSFRSNRIKFVVHKSDKEGLCVNDTVHNLCGFRSAGLHGQHSALLRREDHSLLHVHVGSRSCF